MANRELTEIKVGDEVEFKRDIEGHAQVLEIIKESSWIGGDKLTFIVGFPGASYENWHTACTSHPKYGAVVYLESYSIFAVNGEWV